MPPLPATSGVTANAKFTVTGFRCEACGHFNNLKPRKPKRIMKIIGQATETLKTITLISLVTWFCGCASAPVMNGVPNLQRVDNDILRGGQPTPEGWLWLKNMGVTNVVKLDTEAEGSDAAAERLGVTVHHFPIPFSEQFFGPVNKDNLWGAVDCIQPHTYIHCEHGRDRTGLVVACWRLKHGVPKPDAEREMIGLGFHKELFGLWHFWERLATDEPGVAQPQPLPLLHPME